jgi:hypothetical protein
MGSKRHAPRTMPGVDFIVDARVAGMFKSHKTYS